MFDPPAHFERAFERGLGEGELAVREVRLTPDLRRVGFAPGVAAVGVGGKVERPASGLDRCGRTYRILGARFRRRSRPEDAYMRPYYENMERAYRRTQKFRRRTMKEAPPAE